MLKEAIAAKRGVPLEIPEFLVNQLKHRTSEDSWICHVMPEESASICFSFVDCNKRYEAIVSKVNQSRN